MWKIVASLTDIARAVASFFENPKYHGKMITVEMRDGSVVEGLFVNREPTRKPAILSLKDDSGRIHEITLDDIAKLSYQE